MGRSKRFNLFKLKNMVTKKQLEDRYNALNNEEAFLSDKLRGIGIEKQRVVGKIQLIDEIEQENTAAKAEVKEEVKKDEKKPVDNKSK